MFSKLAAMKSKDVTANTVRYFHCKCKGDEGERGKCERKVEEWSEKSADCDASSKSDASMMYVTHTRNSYT